MNNLNSILIEGNLTRDPEISYTLQGTASCKFAIACNRYYKKEQEYEKEVSFFSVQTWAKLAETCFEYLKKGRGVRVVGRLKQNRWSDEQGNAKSIILIIAEHVEFKPVFKGKEEEKEGFPENVQTEEEANEPDPLAEVLQ